jgi:site-specific DNA-methyltransferase (adenine-specific)
MNTKNKIKIGKLELTEMFEHFSSENEEQDYENLKNDIARFGVHVPILIDEFGNIIDGARRAKACPELMMKDIPVTIIANLTEQEKEEFHLTINSNRKAYSKNNKQEIAVLLRKKQYSLRRIAEVLNISHESARRYVGVTDVTGEEPETVIGKDGHEYPSTVKRSVILARSAGEAQNSCEMLKESPAKHALDTKIIHANKLEPELYKASMKNTPPEQPKKCSIGKADLYCGDFREVCKDIPDNSADIICTDPPYDEASLQLYEDLACIAQRILKPSGILLACSGNLYFPTVIKMLSEHLEYVWTFHAMHVGGNKVCWPVNIYQNYKPILFFQKSPRSNYWKRFSDKISGQKRSKEHHKWEQDIAEAKYFLEALAPKENAVLLDPMAGSGTAILAGLELGMTSIGIDCDPTAYETIQARVSKLQKVKAA